MKTRRAFNLIELMYIVLIIAILAALSIVLITNTQKKARDGKRFSDMNTMIAALKNYKLENGNYPDSGGNWIIIDQSSSPNLIILSTALKPYQSSLPSDPQRDSSYHYAYHSYPASCGLPGPFAVIAFTKVEASNNKYKEKAVCAGGAFNWDSYDYSYLLK